MLKIIPYGAEIPRFALDPESHFMDGSHVGPNQTMNSGHIPFTEQQYNGVRDRESRIIIFSAIAYRDVYDRTVVRRTESCNELLYTGEIVTPEGLPKPDFTFNVVGPQNGAT
jgi:hypothetical protein